MSASEHRQLTCVVGVRLSPAEQAALQQRAQDAGLSAGAYIRQVVFATAPPPRRRQRMPVKDGQALAWVLAQLGRIGGNLNQLTRRANQGDAPEIHLWEAACADIRAMRDRLMVALGAERPEGARTVPTPVQGQDHTQNPAHV